MKKWFKKLSMKHKNNKVLYYSLNFIRLVFPSKIFQFKLNSKIESLKSFDLNYVLNRVNYYNKLDETVELLTESIMLKNFKLKKKHKTYYFDCYEYTRYFNANLRAFFKFGDVTKIPNEPTIVKSRPIDGDNRNSVLLNLDKVRHFNFIKDPKNFLNKKDMLVSRNYSSQPHRIKFLEMYINNPRCNIGKINKNHGRLHLLRDTLTIDEHLDYKFILCIEGNDVATNLKWVMSSNSLAVMPKPNYETWYMEGNLIPNYHYVLINDDYTDLEERMDYYIEHPDEALQIIKNAHEYIEQFKNKEREDLISLLVLEKYFKKTGQVLTS